MIVVVVSAVATLNTELSAAVSVPLVACSLYPVPALSILQPVAVATPDDAVNVVPFVPVPLQINVAPAVPVPLVIDRTIDAELPVTVFPPVS